MYDYTIVGGGIVGLASAMELVTKYPEAKVLLLEKEDRVAVHQTGHNSGVIHSGIYYTPGSYRARFARAGSQSMVEFAKKYNIDHDICGKVIVATDEAELPWLENLYQRGLQNELAIEKIDEARLKEIEPHVKGIAGIRVPQAGIINYKQVCQKMSEIIRSCGSEVLFNTEVKEIIEKKDHVEIQTDGLTYKSRIVVTCAGLFSDRVTKRAGHKLDMQIVPFRGEYYKLVPEKRHLVKNLIYPVPNPAFPFLGVHFTRMIDGEVDAGPNAVLAFKREGYEKTDFSLKDSLDTMTFSGFWKLAFKYMGDGLKEMERSLSKKKFTESLQALIPEIREEDLVPAPAGVRAQALGKNGKLVDDFQFIKGERTVHVCNAPSPAATASIEIGKEVVRQVEQLKTFKEGAKTETETAETSQTDEITND